MKNSTHELGRITLALSPGTVQALRLLDREDLLTLIAEGEAVEPGGLFRKLRALFRRVSREAGPEPRPDGLDMKYLEAVFSFLAGALAEGKRKGREVAITCLQGLVSEVLPLPKPKGTEVEEVERRHAPPKGWQVLDADDER